MSVRFDVTCSVVFSLDEPSLAGPRHAMPNHPQGGAR